MHCRDSGSIGGSGEADRDGGLGHTPSLVAAAACRKDPAPYGLGLWKAPGIAARVPGWYGAASRSRVVLPC